LVKGDGSDSNIKTDTTKIKRGETNTDLVDDKGTKLKVEGDYSISKLEKAKTSENSNLIPDQEYGESEPIFNNYLNQPSEESLSEPDESLIVNWFISNDELCQGEELLVSINNVNEPVELIWDFGDGNTSNDPEVIHKYESPGVYTIKLKANSLISDNKIYREKKYIEVKANPQSNFTIEKSENMEMLPEVNFTNSTKYFSQIEWVFDEDTVDDKKSVKKLYRYKGLYHIGLYVSNQFGCRDSIFKDLIIENDYNLMAPNAFTPNEDGMNDYFMPKALMFLHKQFTMQVISKSGRVVFETQNVESPWNGKLNNSGSLLKNGPYAWTVKLEDGTIYSGSVILMIE